MLEDSGDSFKATWRRGSRCVDERLVVEADVVEGWGLGNGLKVEKARFTKAKEANVGPAQSNSRGRGR